MVKDRSNKMNWMNCMEIPFLHCGVNMRSHWILLGPMLWWSFVDSAFDQLITLILLHWKGFTLLIICLLSLAWRMHQPTCIRSAWYYEWEGFPVLPEQMCGDAWNSRQFLQLWWTGARLPVVGHCHSSKSSIFGFGSHIWHIIRVNDRRLQ